MVLAAGCGTRLKPLTDRMPKPLVPVAGRPMIEYALDKLAAYGIQEVIVNVSHHKEQLIGLFVRSSKSLSFKISEEAEPLETGGGLKKALRLLGSEPLFVVNSDIIWARWKGNGARTAGAILGRRENGFPAACAVKGQGRSAMTKAEDPSIHQNAITRLDGTKPDAPYIIAGIGIFHPRVLQKPRRGKFSSSKFSGTKP